MLRSLVLLSLFYGTCLTAEVSKDDLLVDCKSTAQQNFTLGDKTYLYINCQAKTWSTLTIILDGGKDAQLAVEFHSMQNLAAKDSFKLSTFDGTSNIEIFNGAPQDRVWLPTGQQKLKIEASGGDKGSISVKIYKTCGNANTFGEKEFKSPVLPTNVPTPIVATCNFKLSKFALIDFNEFKLANGSELKFTGTTQDNFSGPFNNTSPPDHVVLAQVNTQIILKLNLSDSTQRVSFFVDDSETCGEMIDTSKNTKIDYTGDVKIGISSCLWLLIAPLGQKTTVKVSSFNLTYVNDLLSVIDGGNSTGKPLLQISALTTKTNPVISSGRYTLVSFQSKNFNSPSEFFHIELSQVNYGGHLEQSGNVTFGEASSDYILSTSDNSNIVVNLQTLLSLNDSQTIEIYDDIIASEPLLKFDKSKAPFDFSSSGSSVRIVAKNFGKSINYVNFNSVPKGSGCTRTFTADHAEGIRLIGECKTECRWIIKPSVPAENGVIYFKVLPNNVQTASIAHLRDGGAPLTVANSVEPFMAAYLSQDGIMVNFQCSNSKNFEMSYVSGNKGQFESVYAASGANLTVTSPFYPGIYPTGDKYSYKFTFVDKNPVYLASFHSFELLPQHSLKFKNNKKDEQFLGTDIPGDLIMTSDMLSTLELQTVDAKSSNNPKGAKGFQMSLTTAVTAEQIDSTKKFVGTGDKCNTSRCIYIIDLTKPDPKLNASISVNLTIALPDKTVLGESDLLVWDGDSILRSPLISSPAALAKGGLFPSRSNKIIISYNGTANLNISYVENLCSFKENNMCLTELMCMPFKWRCNKELNCKDGSDELYCKDGVPPTPTPTPHDSPSGWKTAFWLFMPIFIILGAGLYAGLPIAIRKFRDSRYQQFHDLGDH